MYEIINFSLIYYWSMEESLRPYCGCSTIELRLEFVERHAFRQINVWKRLESGSSRWTRVRSPLIRLTGLWARFYQLIFESDGKHLNYWSSCALSTSLSANESLLTERDEEDHGRGGSEEVWTSKFQRNKRSFLGKDVE